MAKLGRRASLKNSFLRECRFKSDCGHMGISKVRKGDKVVVKKEMTDKNPFGTSKKVVDVDPMTGNVMLEDGSVHSQNEVQGTRH